MEKKEELAHLLYNDYCTSVGGKAFNGDNLPKSDEFFNDQTKQKQANAWRNVAASAINFLDSDSYGGDPVPPDPSHPHP